ncbi:hypothetical protein Xcel_2354 [Xylanimonas cellulosilytica DSM 15894]|uniref:Uncharacterized protein n=1 Tax=Xylanimonas cellulosilytica (strain DSM 15894 / JCM 12276 / CECT 5975 / KCTC 9989 / LMG 20990 / NBRC 107835 / XIL07) TaxID=446471 RepID=D1BVQ1_XYLCX|nr:hypothetical protein [Xylanimonas cellulosilytica]ACZ31370.1 hypothetical protein Xcel_2354 [Xylanimonas cellulosilytica DSM 15894]
MAATALVLLIPIASFAVPVLLIGLVLWLLARERTDDGGTLARAARRHELLVSTLAVLAAAVAAVALLAQPVRWPGWAPAPGVLQALTPFSIAGVFALVRALGELTWPRPRGEVRSAPLTRRTIWSLGGARLKGVLVTGSLLIAGLVATGITADATGRAFTTPPVPLPDGGAVGGSSGPYPGWPYGLPMLFGLAIVAVTTWLALTAITRRRPLAGVPAAHDDAVRRTSSDRLLAAVQLCLGLALAATAWMAGTAIATHGRSFEANGFIVENQGLVTLGVVLMVAAAAVAIASGTVALLALRSRRVPRSGLPTPQGALA